MKITPKSKLKLLASCGLIVLPLGLSAQIVWDGDTDNVYETGTNWVGDVAPADDLTTDVAQFTADAVNLGTTRQVSGLDFAVGNTLSGIGSIEVGAGGIAVSGNSTIDTAGLVLNQATAITLNGTLGISSVLTGTGDLTVTAGTATDFSMTGVNGTDAISGYTGNITFDGINATVSRYFMGGNDDDLDTGLTLSLLNGATLNASNHMVLASRDIIISGGATINQFGSNNVYQLDGVISGTDGLTFGHVSGSGGNRDKVQLQGILNTYTGGTLIDGVDVEAGGNGSFGEGTENITLDNGGKLVTSTNLDQRSLIINAGGGALHSNGGIDVRNTVTGTGDLTLTGSNFEWYADGSARTGNTTVDGATVFFRNGGTDVLGASTGTITLDNGGRLYNRNNNPIINSDVVLGSGGGILQVGWTNRRIEVNGEVSGAGALLIGNDSSAVRLLNSANSYSGGTDVQGYVNAVSGGFGTGAVTLNNVDGGTARGGVQNYLGVAVHTNDLIVGANGGRLKAGWAADLEFQGVTSGAGQLTIQEDSGTVVLSNTANTFTGNIVFDGVNSRIRVASLGTAGTYSGNVSGAGIFGYAFPTTPTLDGAYTHTGGTAINGVTVLASEFPQLNCFNGGQDIILQAGGTLDVEGTVIANNFLNATGGTLLNNGAAVDYSSNTFTQAGGSFIVDGTGDVTIGDITRTAGDPLVIKNGSSTLTMVGAADNVSARAEVNTGTLVLAKTSSGSVHAIGGLLTINGGTAQLSGTGGDQIYNGATVTLNGGTLDMNSLNERTKFLNLYAGTVSGGGVLTVNSFGGGANDGFIDAQSGTISSVLSGDAPLAKTTAGTVTLSGANTNSGDITVSDGILTITQVNPSNESATVTLVSPGILDLTSGATDTVDRLFLDGVQQDAGVYGSGDTALITGTGTLTVTSGPPTAPFDIWTAAKGLTFGVNDGPNDDPDGDGDNLYEYFFWDSDPLVADVFGSELTGVDGSGALSGDLVFSHDRPLDISDVTVVYQWTADLTAGWNDDGVADGSGNNVSFATGATSAPANGNGTDYESVEVTASVTAGTPTQIFVRVSVTQP
ncbi:MAG: beta strand repeat-containing protein [Opitutaceae bacterium]